MEKFEQVFKYLSSIADFEEGDLKALAEHIQELKYKRGEVVFHEGEKFNKILFLNRGLLKKFYTTSEGKEFIKEFVWEGQSTTPYASILMGRDTTYSMIALEETQVMSIDYALVKKMIDTDYKWLKLAKSLADFHFLNRESREMELLKFSAAQRYDIFKNKFPHLIERLKKQDIAMYLGITPTALSRLEQFK